MDTEQNNSQTQSRRGFLKKTVYHAPVLYTLGSLLKPTTVHADTSGGPPGPPGGLFSSQSSRSIKSRSKKSMKLRF